jgi:hypothetical protein
MTAHLNVLAPVGLVAHPDVVDQIRCSISQANGMTPGGVLAQQIWWPIQMLWPLKSFGGSIGCDGPCKCCNGSCRDSIVSEDVVVAQLIWWL